MINGIGLFVGLFAVNTPRNAAIIGADTLVPPTVAYDPFTKILTPVLGSAIAEISGVWRCVPGIRL